MMDTDEQVGKDPSNHYVSANSIPTSRSDWLLSVSRSMNVRQKNHKTQVVIVAALAFK